jgi:hypothetical protein
MTSAMKINTPTATSGRVKAIPAFSQYPKSLPPASTP